MRIGARGRVTIPKMIREKFGLRPKTEVEFCVDKGSIILRKVLKKLNLRKWKGRGKDRLTRLGYSSVDEFIDDVRGRIITAIGVDRRESAVSF